MVPYQHLRTCMHASVCIDVDVFPCRLVCMHSCMRLCVYAHPCQTLPATGVPAFSLPHSSHTRTSTLSRSLARSLSLCPSLSSLSLSLLNPLPCPLPPFLSCVIARAPDPRLSLSEYSNLSFYPQAGLSAQKGHTRLTWPIPTRTAKCTITSLLQAFHWLTTPLALEVSSPFPAATRPTSPRPLR